MNPYGMIHSNTQNSLVHDHNQLSRMLHIPVVPQQLTTTTITNSAMRVLGSLAHENNNIHMNGTTLGMSGNSNHEHSNRLNINQPGLDHCHRSSQGNTQDGNSTNPVQVLDSRVNQGNLDHRQKITPNSGGNGQEGNSIPRQEHTQQGSSTLELHPDMVLENFFEETDDRPHICQVCTACYKTRTHLKRHMCVHLKARPYTCSFPDCGKGFNRKGTEHLNKHYDAVHRLSKFKCSFCAKEISRKDHLNRHIKNMHTFPIPPGGTRRGQGTSSAKKKKGNTTNGTQQVITSSSHIETKLDTSRCQMNSMNTIGPTQHHYQHGDFSNGKPPTSAAASGLLELFTCGECSATFVSENDLSIHIKTHKPQPYKCSECSRAYTRREKLTEHVRCFHQGQKFTCEYCGKDLSRKDHVLRHVRSVHPEVLASQFVEMAESNGIDPASVINARSNGSGSLNPASTSSSSTGTNNSIPSMGEMGALLKSVCHICLKVFGTSYHLARHVQSVHNQNMRPYSCTFCSKQFKRKDHLTNHMKSHCPSQREISPSAGQVSINNLLNGTESIRQHAINSLQIEMLSPDTEQKERETNDENAAKEDSSEDSDPGELKFLKVEKQDHQICDMMGLPSSQNQSLHLKRAKESQEKRRSESSSELSEQSRSGGGSPSTPVSFCGQCHVKFHSDGELVHHLLQKHGQESHLPKDSFQHSLWDRAEAQADHHLNNRS